MNILKRWLRGLGDGSPVQLGLYLATIVLSVLFIWGGNRFAYRDMPQLGSAGMEAPEYVSARVDLVLAKDVRPLNLGGFELESGTVYFQATITSGSRKGVQVGAEQIHDPMMAVKSKDVEAGDRITLILYEPYPGGDKVWTFQQYDRMASLTMLGLAFGVLLVLFGGKKGFHTILSLVFTCLAIFVVFVPLILAGYNIYAATFAVCTFIALVTLVLINGYNKKSLSALVGCIGGLLVSGGLVWLMGGVLNLTGMVDEESSFLLFLNPANPIDLKAIIFSGILIGALGATLDVAVSMASSISELALSSSGRTFASLMRSATNIGRDIMGTMTNTLILAYIGGSLSLSLLLIVYSTSMLDLLNREMIVVEILQAVSGSIGLLCAIPLTALFASYIYTMGKGSGGEAAAQIAAGEPLPQEKQGHEGPEGAGEMTEHTIRPERKEEWRAVEELHREAFWNWFVPGCDEHYLAHLLRSSADFIPELDLVAELDGKLVGSIMFTRSWIEKEDGSRKETLTFGPLGVLPQYQNRGIGGALIKAAHAKALELGYDVVSIFGYPTYYSRFGFRPAKSFGVTNEEGRYPVAHQIVELKPDAMNGVKGRFVHCEIFQTFEPKQAEDFDKGFAPKEKLETESQKEFARVAGMYWDA